MECTCRPGRSFADAASFACTRCLQECNAATKLPLSCFTAAVVDGGGGAAGQGRAHWKEEGEGLSAESMSQGGSSCGCQAS